MQTIVLTVLKMVSIFIEESVLNIKTMQKPTTENTS